MSFHSVGHSQSWSLATVITRRVSTVYPISEVVILDRYSPQVLTGHIKGNKSNRKDHY